MAMNSNGLNFTMLLNPNGMSPSLDELNDEQKKMLRLSLLSNAFGNIANLGAGRPNESPVPGMLAMTSMFSKENEKKKTAKQMKEAFDAAMTPAVPEAYKVSGQSFTNPAEATKAAAPYSTTLGGYSGGLTSGLDSMTGAMPPPQYNLSNMNIPQRPVDYQPAKPAGFDITSLTRNMMGSGNPDLMGKGLDLYARMMPEAGKPQLVDVFDPAQGKTVKRWVRPGESTGVDVGLAPPDKSSTSTLGQLIAERDSIPVGNPRRKAYDNAILKATTHQPPVRIENYGGMVPAVNTATGQDVFLQPSNRGGAKEISGYTTPSSYEKAAKAKAAGESRLSTFDNLERSVIELLNHPGLDSAVGWGTLTPTLPSSEKVNAITAIENLGSKAAINTINDMKAMSASGGAVGQVSEKEWPKLEAAFGNLDRRQSPKQYRENLKKALMQLRESKRRVNNAIAGQRGSTGQQSGTPPGLTPEEWNAMTPEEKALWEK